MCRRAAIPQDEAFYGRYDTRYFRHIGVKQAQSRLLFRCAIAWRGEENVPRPRLKEICRMSKVTRPTIAGILFLVCLLATPCLSFAHGEITNSSGKPLKVLDLNDTQGKPFARLFMSGERMTIDHYNYPESGAGYYEALEGNYYYIPFTKGGLGGLHVDKVEWDENGKTIAIKGLRPFFDGAEQIKITSDVTDPKIEDGIVYLRLKGKADTEFKFKVIYGVGISIEPQLDE